VTDASCIQFSGLHSARWSLKSLHGIVLSGHARNPKTMACYRLDEYQTVKQSTKGTHMLSWSLTFLIIALIAAALGFIGVAGTAATIAQILFVVFLVLFLVSLIGRGRRGA
jgi:uncharacterized membrane protein YtjA (UPF0391 family)